MGATTTEIASSAKRAAGSSLSARKRHGRAVNSAADFLRQRLRVPEIYLEPGAPLKAVDLIAVDSAGSGDIHVVEVKVSNAATLSTREVLAQIQKLKAVPAHFKYLALPIHPALRRLMDGQSLFSNDGIGRIGLLKLIEVANGTPQIELLVTPERFRVPSAEMSKIENLLQRSKPDIFVRV
jgi:hypothetical protein